MPQISTENLIFIISQPRSGSSLLQQILIGTGVIKSIPEPWLMLPLIHVNKPTNISQGYNPSYAHVNLTEYLSNYEDASAMLKEQVKDLAIRLYNLNTLKNDEVYFLDKTPRYYHIAFELLDLFPEAKFIVLTRNPLSVFSSILEYNLGGDVEKIFRDDRYDDVVKAPEILKQLKLGIKDKSNMFYLRYEDMVEDHSVIDELLEFLDINRAKNKPYHYSLDDIFSKSNARDMKSLDRHNSISSNYLASWKLSIDNKVKKDLLLEYIELLGEDTFRDLGYEYIEALEAVKSHKVKYKLPLSWEFLKKKRNEITILELIRYRVISRINSEIL